MRGLQQLTINLLLRERLRVVAGIHSKAAHHLTRVLRRRLRGRPILIHVVIEAMLAADGRGGLQTVVT